MQSVKDIAHDMLLGFVDLHEKCWDIDYGDNEEACLDFVDVVNDLGKVYREAKKRIYEVAREEYGYQF